MACFEEADGLSNRGVQSPIDDKIQGPLGFGVEILRLCETLLYGAHVWTSLSSLKATKVSVGSNSLELYKELFNNSLLSSKGHLFGEV